MHSPTREDQSNTQQGPLKFKGPFERATLRNRAATGAEKTYLKRKRRAISLFGGPTGSLSAAQAVCLAYEIPQQVCHAIAYVHHTCVRKRPDGSIAPSAF